MAQTATIDQQKTDEATLIFVRHAEKMDDGTNDPSLNTTGKERAAQLAELLKNEYELSAIYSTNYNRTKETAKPVADIFDLEINFYDLKDPKGLMEQIKSDHKGQTVLIVGHSNTTPMLVNIAAGVQEFEALDEKTYGKIFIVNIGENTPPSVFETEMEF